MAAIPTARPGPRWAWPSVSLRRGPLSVIAWAAFVFLAHHLLAELGFHLGAVASGALTLAVMLAAACYGARRRFVVLSLYMVGLFSAVPLLRPFKRLAVRFDQLRSWRLAHLGIGTLAVLP